MIKIILMGIVLGLLIFSLLFLMFKEQVGESEKLFGDRFYEFLSIEKDSKEPLLMEEEYSILRDEIER